MGENSVCNFSQLGPQGFTYHPVAMRFLNDITVASQALHTEQGAETAPAQPARPGPSPRPIRAPVPSEVGRPGPGAEWPGCWRDAGGKGQSSDEGTEIYFPKFFHIFFPLSANERQNR